MKPSEFAKSLRKIASKIEASKTPSRALVSRDLRRVLANMGTMTNEQLAGMLSDADLVPTSGGLSAATTDQPWTAPDGMRIEKVRSTDPDSYDENGEPWRGTVVSYQGAEATYDQTNGEWAPGRWA